MSKNNKEILEENAEISVVNEVEVPEKNEIKEKSKPENKKVEVVLMAVKRMTITVYLQKKPQEKYIESMLKSKYKGVVHTEAEWDSIVEQITGKRITQ